ncbi:MAG TPA: hypothetical protein VK907_06180, partial [Phnomibacter sp.]|nr:hypothetical protein [Phnomibacter sp.]
MSRIKRMMQLKHWEYWPFHRVYGPIYPIFAWYVIRSGFRFFFSAANPTIYSGGFLMESKKKVYDLLPEGSYPTTFYIVPGTTADALLQMMAAGCMNFPVILKPDIGGRGRGVVVAHNEEELEHYAALYDLPYLLQDFVPYEQEAGIFYARMPGEKRGRVTGIVGKGFATITGDGRRTIEEHILADDRLKRYINALRPALGERIHTVPAPGETEMLMPFGNHARGAAFYNWSYLIDDRIHRWADALADTIDGFHYGRLDIRFHSWEALLHEDRFSIIELNGAGSEPTHIYDPSQSIFYAWREIIRHWHILWRVSR